MDNHFCFNKLLINLISKPVFNHIVIRSMQTATKPKSKDNESTNNTINESDINKDLTLKSNNSNVNTAANTSANTSTNVPTNEDTNTTNVPSDRGNIDNMFDDMANTTSRRALVNEPTNESTSITQGTITPKYESSVNTELTNVSYRPTNEGTMTYSTSIAQGTDIDSMFKDMASTPKSNKPSNEPTMHNTSPNVPKPMSNESSNESNTVNPGSTMSDNDNGTRISLVNAPSSEPTTVSTMQESPTHSVGILINEGTNIQPSIQQSSTNVNDNGTRIAPSIQPNSTDVDYMASTNDNVRISLVNAPLGDNSRITNDIRSSRGSLNSNSANSLETED